jgi:hypothetical protein
MMRVSKELLDVTPIARAVAIAIAMMMAAIKTSQHQPNEGRGRKVFVDFMICFSMFGSLEKVNLEKDIASVLTKGFEEERPPD